MHRVPLRYRVHHAIFTIISVCLLLVAVSPSARAEPPHQALGYAYLLYRLSLTGAVGGDSFQRSGQLFITEPITPVGVKPTNAYDVLLLSGRPAITPELGAINFASSSFFFGRDTDARHTAFDLARVSLNETETGLAIQMLPVTSAERNTFNPRPGWFGNVYEVNAGTMQLELSGASERVSGQISVTGTGFIFFLTAPYRATFSGTLIDQGEF